MRNAAAANRNACAARLVVRLLAPDLPSGDFPFLSGSEVELGEYLTCPMIAEMMQFSDQEATWQTALAIIDGRRSAK